MQGTSLNQILYLILFLALNVSGIGRKKTRNRHLENFKPVAVYGIHHPLVNIVDATIRDSTTVVLTSAFPSVHLYHGNSYRAWGRKGDGPGELKSPAAVTISQDTIFVLDARPGFCKMVSYNLQGDYIASVAVTRGRLCRGFKMSGHFRVVEVGTFGSQKRSLLSVGSHSQAIAHFTVPAPVKLQINGGPMHSFSFHDPFKPQPAWGVAGAGKLIMWDGKSRRLKVSDADDSRTLNSIKVPENKINVPSTALNNWLDKQFPSDKTVFGKQNFYKNVRREIQNRIQIPHYYPLLRDIKTDPHGNIWLLRAYFRHQGQVWLFIPHKGDNDITVHFPEGRTIKAFGSQYIVAKVKTQNGTEHIELYNRKDFL